MKIAVCTLAGSPEDVTVWSGTPAHFVQGLRSAGAEVISIGPLYRMAYQLLNKVSGASGRLGRKLNWETEPLALRMFTRALDAQLDRIRPDVVILMGWFPLNSRSEIPMIYWGDATIGQRIDLAPHWSNLSARTRTQAQHIEAKCLGSLAGTFWASKWAQNDAINRYGLTNTHCVPFASNLEDPLAVPRGSAQVRPTQLLAVGVKWHRKGMDRAVAAADNLVAQGLDVHLDVVGVHPPDNTWLRAHVTYHGRLRKDRPTDVQKLHSLYTKADIFVLPTRNEPFGIVFQEAAAYALPSVAAKIGGVPEIIEHGVTGLTLEEDASTADYALAISTIIKDKSIYATMSRSARTRYEEHFTWARCGQRVMGLVENMMSLARGSGSS
ncbi:glycosyltransferase family 4 protein [Arthrobacter sp. UYEF36]|uniref:glycosyltransferase family 4 protein n=1 Tax=Arthrobacter sp. UYEF36 TaxID=1756366 RepID=UPI00339A4447